MSWKGFTKALARLPHQLAKSTGHSSETHDETYDVLEASFKQLETLAKQLKDDARRFRDQLGAMLAHQAGLANAFQDMFSSLDGDFVKTDEGFSPDHAGLAEEFAREMNELKESLSSDLDMVERLVVAPAGDFATILEQVKKVMVKRSHKLIDYDRHRESVQRLREKTDRSASDEKRLGQLESQLDQATRDYNAINNQLKQDLPVLLALRVDFIDPCLLAFYTYQMKVHQTLHAKFADIGQRHFDLRTSALQGYQMQADAVAELLTTLVIPKRSQGHSANPSSDTPGTADSSSKPPALGMSPPPYTPGEPMARETSGSGGSRSGAPGPATLPPRVLPGAPVPQYVLALYDFDAQAEGDLSFRRDDKIEIVQRTEDVNDWWIGRIDGRTGQFPANYVRML
ncbi:BAR adaptor protein Hob1 [Polyrhizophydium stewartii]|uniref:BAR adaptor protein Hob1 n=1 Tax=Polyrhizophydium stewartii TaxID=2732419 RepID=A0ABR4N905_9FUNG|nr:hypothetical protein HK105_007038 [Polyrhizophydium stewartii]